MQSEFSGSFGGENLLMSRKPDRRSSSDCSGNGRSSGGKGFTFGCHLLGLSIEAPRDLEVRITRAIKCMRGRRRIT
jgi:hypothetical protein